MARNGLTNPLEETAEDREKRLYNGLTKKEALQLLNESETDEQYQAILSMFKHNRARFKAENKSLWTPETVTQACVEYLELCGQKNLRPSMHGLSVYMGVEMRTLQYWRKKPEQAELGEIISMLKDFLITNHIQRLEGNTTANMFMLRVLGLSDTQKVEITNNNIETSRDEIEEQIAKLGLTK